MAARRESRKIDFGTLVRFCQTAIAAHTGTMLIEGIGGVMVPLDDSHTVLDWMAALNIPLVLVTGSYLGSVSHILTCLDVLKRRELAIRAIVVNESSGSSVPLADTVVTLSHFTTPTPIIAMPRLQADSAQCPVFGEIAALL
jgi:dethiobiotin synthetase